jgi:hypothetical protein
MRFVLALLAAAAVFGWQASAQAIVRIRVDLSSQTMRVTSSEGGDYDWPVSTGRPGYRTPTGAYRPQRMFVMTHSSEYENAPMPHAIFFTGGYAIHGSYETRWLGRPASHGCVRLAPAHAAILYDLVRREGASILISGTAPGGEAVASARHRGGRASAVSWRTCYRDDEASYAPQVSPYEVPLGAWTVYPLDGQ